MNVEISSLSPRARSWNAALVAHPGALDLELPAGEIEGQVPEALYGGQLLSNGPGWNRIGDWNLHPFDGHGYVRAFAFELGGGCRLRARFVETEVYRDELAAGRLVHRGLGTNLEGPFWRNMGQGKVRNVANTTITRWGDKLLAGWEGGLPHALDPRSLETRGPEDFGGLLAAQITLAHMRHDHRQDRLVLSSFTREGFGQRFVFREFDRDEQPVVTREAELPELMFAHDFAISPGYYVLGGNRLRLRPGRLLETLVGRSPMIRSLALDDARPGCLHLVPRDRAGAVRTVRLPEPGMVIHFGNAFEREGDLIVDACVIGRFVFGEEFGYRGPRLPFDPALPDAQGTQQLVRITVPAGASEASWRPLTAHGVDFPRFHPEHEGRETPRLFGATRADTRYSDPFDSVIGLDLLDPERPADLWTAPEHVFVGEPIPVPDPAGEGPGHVLAILSDGLRERTTVAVFQAAELPAGPVAQLHFPLLPIAFHGDWSPL